MKITVKDTAIMSVQIREVTAMLDPRVSLFEHPKNNDEEWAQNFALNITLTGVRKNLSQVAIIDLYDTSMLGVRSYHQSKLWKIEVNGKKIPLPPRVTLNVDNVHTIQKSLLNSYKLLEV